MIDASQIKEHVEVVGSDGNHVGTVDHMEGRDQIKLTRQDEDAGGQHHYIPLEWVASADGTRVTLDKPAAEAERNWTAD
jgi:hypothetical protein